MTMEEFYDVTDEISKFYGKDINSYERNIWYDELGKLKVERYKRIVRECFRREKFMPKLADILKIKNDLPTEKEEWIPVECEKCDSTGMIAYHKKDKDTDLSYLFVCRCNCENGQRLSKKIPRVEEINV